MGRVRQRLSRAAWWLLGVIVGVVGGIALAALLLYIKENKGLKKEDWIRLAMHLPWGLMAVGLFLVHPVLGATACFMELGYEFANDWRKRDNSYRDILGIVDGILLGGYILLLLKFIGVDLGL